jgi:hypothetical protein
MSGSDQMICIVLVTFFVTLLFTWVVYAVHEENMAKAGLQQCRVASSVLWQKECK